LAYEIIVRQRGKRFHLHIRELRLWASSEDLAEAHRSIAAQLRDKIQAYVEAGAADEIPPPARRLRKDRFYYHVRGFAIRSAIATLCGVILIAAALLLLTAYLSPLRSILALTESSLRNMSAPGGWMKSLDYLATSLENIPPDQREKAAGDMQRIVKALEPFATELRSEPVLPDAAPVRPAP
jgi:hypothetical protein